MKNRKNNLLSVFAIVAVPLAVLVGLIFSFFYGKNVAFARLKRKLGISKPPEFPSQERIELIGCGISRSGSTSTVVALEMLGYRVYHGTEVFKNEGHMEMWINAYKEPDKYLKVAIDELLRLGFNATSPGSIPTGPLCLEIRKMFRESKVMFNVRDNENVWLESFKEVYDSVAPAFYHDGGFPLFLFFDDLSPMFDLVLKPWGVKYELTLSDPILPWVQNYAKSITFHTDEGLKDGYLNFIEKVKEEIPEDQLLVFNVKEGWDPLVKFLDVDVSDLDLGEFPHLNSRAIYAFFRILIPVLAYGYPFIIIALLVAIFFTCKILLALIRMIFSSE